MKTITTPPAATPHLQEETEEGLHRGFGRPAAVLMIGAPLVMALARALIVPFDDQNWDRVLTNMAAHQGRSDTGWLLAIAASGLLAATAIVFAHRLQLVGRSRSAIVVITSTALGWAGCAAIAGGGLIMSVAAKAPDRAVQVQILKSFNTGHSGLVFLMCVIAAAGYLFLAVNLARAGVVSKGAAVLIGLGGASTLLTMPGPFTPLLITAAVLLAAGQALALRAPR
jgi:hypothetical protein